MPRYEGLVHHKLQPGIEPGTRPPAEKLVRTQDEDISSPDYLYKGMTELREALGIFARLIENRAYPVDEYNTQPITGAASESTLTVLPTYEYRPERIESIIVTGPGSTQITLQLGDRIWSLTIPASGLLEIGPLGIILGRSDLRQLTSQTPGTYTLELMGYAQRRFKI